MGLAAAVGGAAAVFVAMLIALTLLPAMLGFAGHKVAKFISTPLRPGHHEKVALTAATEPEQTFGAAWARFVIRYRVILIVVGVGRAARPGAAATRIELGLPSGASKPKSDTARKAVRPDHQELRRRLQRCAADRRGRRHKRRSPGPARRVPAEIARRRLPPPRWRPQGQTAVVRGRAQDRAERHGHRDPGAPHPQRPH